MKLWMIIIQAVFCGLISFLLTACSPTGGVMFIYGEPYFCGDERCVRYRQDFQDITNKWILCYTKDNEFTEVRRAMTPAELQQYQYNQLMQAIQVNETLNQLNQTINQLNQTIMINSLNRPRIFYRGF